MNLFIRMIWILISCWRKPDIKPTELQNSLFLKVLPNDLDINMHMNNGRYLTVCDLSRIDFFIRTGLARAMLANKWMPIIAEHTMSYKRPLGLFNSYQLDMSIERWDEKFFYCRHVFIVDGREVAVGTSKAVIKAVKGEVIAPLEVVQYLVLQQQNKLAQQGLSDPELERFKQSLGD